MNDYIPRSILGFDRWIRELAKMVTARAVAWNIPFDKVTKLNDRLAAYHPLFQAVSQPANCTRAQKLAFAKKSAELRKEARSLVNEKLRNNSLIKDDERMLMGIRNRKKTRSKRAAIQEEVLFKVSSMNDRRLKFICRRETEEGRTGKHPLADAVEVRYAIGKRPRSPSACSGSFICSKAFFILNLDDDISAGETVYIFVRWRNLVDESKSGPFGNMQQVLVLG